MLLTPADILGIANQTDPTRGATEVGYSADGTPTTVAGFLNELANGTATLAPTLTGTETVPISKGSGLLQTTTDDIAQLAVNIKNSEVTVPVGSTTTNLSFAQYNAGIITFTGTLMSNSFVQLPSTSGIWVFANDTTGAYSLTLQTGMRGALVKVLTYQVYLNNWQGSELLYTTPRTNLIPDSSMVGGTLWTDMGTTVQTNYLMDPAGTTTGSLLTATTAGTTARVYPTTAQTITASTTYTASIYIKQGTSTLPEIAIYDSTATTQIASVAVSWPSGGMPTISTTSGILPGSATVMAASATGWYVVTFSFSSGTYTAVQFVIYPDGNNGTASTGVAFPQLEMGALRTSYIATTTGPVTVTDYTITSAGMVTLAMAPTMNATLTWTGTYLDAVGGEGIEANMLFGTGNGVLTSFQLTPTTGTGGAVVLAEQGTPILAYSDGTNVYAVAAGGGGGTTTLTTYNFVATAGQTQVNVNYVPGNIVVSRNGAVLPTSDYTATSGAYVTFTTPLNAGDELTVLVFGAFSAVGAISAYALTATAGQTTFTAGYTPGAVEVFQNGVLLMPSDYMATNGTSVTLNMAASAGDQIQIISQNTTSVANTVPITGGTFTGPVMVDSTVTSTTGGFIFPDSTTQGSAAMGKNRIINGACNVAQRAAIAYTYGITGYSGPDRYYATNSSTAANGQFTQSQGTISYGGLTLNAVVQTVNTAIVTDATTNYWSGITQKIEGFNCYDLLGQPVALSFVFNTNVSGTYSVSLQDGTAVNSWVTTFTAVANTPMKVVIPVSMLPLTLATPNSSALGLWLWVGALNTGTYATSNLGAWQTGNFISASTATNWAMATGNFIALTKLQLERGSLPTPFEYRSYGTELALCQRYYEAQMGMSLLWAGYGNSGVAYSTLAPFHTVKRSIPTITFSNIGYGGFSGLELVAATIDNIEASATGNTTGPGMYYYASWTASAEL